MNRISTLLSIVALVLVGVLYYLHFSHKDHAGLSSGNSKSDSTRPTTEFKMAYFEMDSVDKNYEYVQEIKENLRKKEESVNIQLNAMKSGYQKKIQEWQQKGQNMSQAESDAINREYQQMQMTYDTKQKQLSDDLESERIKMLMDVHKKISEYLKEYNKNRGYTYIITDEQSLIYYKDTVYNITRDVLAGLNSEYKSKGKAKKE